MTPFEDRLKASLHARATDVEPTPALWTEVDRRLTRRRRSIRLVWTTAALAAVTAAVLIVPGLLGPPPTPVPDIADEVDRVEDDARDDPTDADDTPADNTDDTTGDTDDTTDDTTGDTDDTTGDGTAPDAPRDAGRFGRPMLVAAGQQLRILDAEGATLRELALPAEGESVVVGLAVRPGSTPESLTAVVSTQAEGMWDLRTLRIAGDDVSWTVFEGPYAPGPGDASRGQVHGPLWSPDGDSLAWLERDATGTTLRTIGWEDGPGTGRPADDNAAFALDDVDLLDLRPAAWVATDGTSSTLRLVSPDPDDAFYELAIERQPDGALALDDTRPRRRVPDPTITDGAPVVGVAGWVTDPVAARRWRWLVVLDADGLRAWPHPGADHADVVELPAALLPGDGLPELGALATPEGLLVVGHGSARAVLVHADGRVDEVPGEVAWVQPLAPIG